MSIFIKIVFSCKKAQSKERIPPCPTMYLYGKADYRKSLPTAMTLNKSITVWKGGAELEVSCWSDLHGSQEEQAAQAV